MVVVVLVVVEEEEGAVSVVEEEGAVVDGAPVVEVLAVDEEGGCSDFGVLGFEASATASRAGVSRSFIDLEGASDRRRISAPGVGVEANSL